MNSSPLVYIVILNWNKNDVTLSCIKSVFNSSYLHYKILVIDNAPVEKLESKLTISYPSVDYIYSPQNLGFTGGVNLGIKYALEHGAEYVWLLNNDVIVLPDTLTKLIRCAESDTRLGLISPIIVDVNNPRKPFFGAFWDVEGGILLNAYDKDTYLDWESQIPEKISLWGTALLIKKNLIEKIGLFDDDYFAYYEDNDYSYRSSKAGFLNKTCIEARVTHETDPIEIIQQKDYRTFLMTRNYFLFLIKCGISRSDTIYRTLEYFLPKISRFSESIKKTQLHPTVAGLWYAIILNEFGAVPKEIKVPTLVIKILVPLAKPLYNALPKIRRFIKRVRRRLNIFKHD